MATRPDPSEPDMSAALLKRHCGLTGSIATLSSEVSANTRYLQPRLIDYAERLVDTFPNEIDRVVFTCTGSESNDLALRIAVAAVSPNLGDAVKLSPFVRMVSLPGLAGVPDTQAGEYFEAQVRSAILALNRRGIGVATLLFDSIFQRWRVGRSSRLHRGRRCGGT